MGRPKAFSQQKHRKERHIRKVNEEVSPIRGGTEAEAEVVGSVQASVLTDILNTTQDCLPRH